MPGLVLFELVRKRSPWPVGELEESVVAWLLDLAARLDEPNDELVMGPVISIQTHRAKLEHREWLYHLRNALLSKEDRTARAQLHQGGDQQEKRRKHHHECQAADRKPADRFRIQPLGELSTDSSVEPFARISHIRRADLGQNDADHSPQLEPPS